MGLSFFSIIFFHTSLNTLQNSCCFLVIIRSGGDVIDRFIFATRITAAIVFGTRCRRARITSMMMMVARGGSARRRSRRTMTAGWTRTKLQREYLDEIVHRGELTVNENVYHVVDCSNVNDGYANILMIDDRIWKKFDIQSKESLLIDYLDRDRRRSRSRSRSLLETFPGGLRRDER